MESRGHQCLFQGGWFRIIKVRKVTTVSYRVTPKVSWTLGTVLWSGPRRLLTMGRFCCRIGLLACLLTGVAPLHGWNREGLKPAATKILNPIDNDLLDDLSRRSFRYFWEQTNLGAGLVLVRALTSGETDNQRNHEGVASIAATGFGLTAYCIAADHRWISHEMARQRVLAALLIFANRASQEHGWFYH